DLELGRRPVEVAARRLARQDAPRRVAHEAAGVGRPAAVAQHAVDVAARAPEVRELRRRARAPARDREGQAEEEQAADRCERAWHGRDRTPPRPVWRGAEPDVAYGSGHASRGSAE